MVALMLKLVDIGKTFASQIALSQVNLEIRDGEFFSLLGPSGCGKTTLLRIIAGFESASSGQILWDNLPLGGIKPQDRPFNMVFQKYALFPHMTVFDNVAYGLRVKNVDSSTLKDRVEEALSLVGLSDFRERLPETLSGGQAQRVALARAVVNKPKILLLDEPLSALDQKMRERMQTELRELQRRVGITFIFVTHDQEEAMALSDRIAVFNKGLVEQVSTPEGLYSKPETLFVAQFIGSSGSLSGHVRSSPKSGESALVLDSGVTLRGQGHLNGAASGIAVVRPECIQILKKGQTPYLSAQTNNRIRGQIQTSIFKGSQREIQVHVSPNQTLKVYVRDEISMAASLAHGSEVELLFSPQDTFMFPSS
jgi:spermidine/putrescine transport system ATP-binding protein